MSVILNVAPVGLSTTSTAGLLRQVRIVCLVTLLFNAQFRDQVRIKDNLQLIKGISNVLQRLLKYFNGLAISTSFILSISSNFTVVFVL